MYQVNCDFGDDKLTSQMQHGQGVCERARVSLCWWHSVTLREKTPDPLTPFGTLLPFTITRGDTWAEEQGFHKQDLRGGNLAVKRDMKKHGSMATIPRTPPATVPTAGTEPGPGALATEHIAGAKTTNPIINIAGAKREVKSLSLFSLL